MTTLAGAPRLLLVGCGNMGRAILDGWFGAGAVPADTVTVVDPAAPGLPAGVTHLRAVPTGRSFEAIVLAVKPQLLDSVAPALRPLAGPGVVLLSILAGVGHARLGQLFPEATVIRFMGNLAAAHGLSPLAVYAGRTPLAPGEAALVRRLLDPLGSPEWLDEEALLHAVTALGGSGPGFVYRFLAALAKGGEALGLGAAEAAGLALTTVRGAAELAARSGAGASHDDFAALAARVASPGGTTAAGLAVLEADEAIDRLVAATLRAARDRSEELARG